jgi:ATP-dependent RNA helicase RhlB
VTDDNQNNAPSDGELEQKSSEIEGAEGAEKKTEPVAEEVICDDFATLELNPALADRIKQLNWSKPTPVQGMCLPLTTKGKDVAGFAQTGTGKTGVFLITIANRLLNERVETESMKYPFAVILAPTRELALQIQNDADDLFVGLEIQTLAVFGGMDYEKQARALREGRDIIVATPGRLKDFLQKSQFDIKNCKTFVCDEADRMLDMGFIEDVEFFLEKLADSTQKLLFSATTNETVKELAFEYLEHPKYISVNPEVLTPENIDQHAIICSSVEKLRVLIGLLRDHKPKCCIVFTNTKLVADWLHFKLVNNGFAADIITGDLPQRKRIELIKKIKAGDIRCLIATDIASRGLHISGVTHVYNFDIPDEAANYVHRVGRTARAGAKGKSFSLVCEDYGHNLVGVQGLLGDKVEIPVTWPDQEYLKIIDVAANPYHQRAEARSARQGKDQSQGLARGAARDSRRSSQNRKPGGRPSREGQRTPDRSKNRNQSKPHKQQSNQQATNERGGARGNSPRHMSAINAVPPKGMLGWVRKIFKVLFR